MCFDLYVQTLNNSKKTARVSAVSAVGVVGVVSAVSVLSVLNAVSVVGAVSTSPGSTRLRSCWGWRRGRRGGCWRGPCLHAAPTASLSAWPAHPGTWPSRLRAPWGPLQKAKAKQSNRDGGNNVIDNDSHNQQQTTNNKLQTNNKQTTNKQQTDNKQILCNSDQTNLISNIQ